MFIGTVPTDTVLSPSAFNFNSRTNHHLSMYKKTLNFPAVAMYIDQTIALNLNYKAVTHHYKAMLFECSMSLQKEKKKYVR
jgi:hypothetical protein